MAESDGMNKKQQFLKAIEILAPGDSFIFEAAEQVPDQDIPNVPGGAALEFVVAMERLRSSVAGTARPFSRNLGLQHRGCKRKVLFSLRGIRLECSSGIPFSVTCHHHPQTGIGNDVGMEAHRQDEVAVQE